MIDNNNKLQQAIELATNMHKGQFDKCGMPYILHPIEVMINMQNDEYGNNNMLIVAILHDVIEDSDRYILDSWEDVWEYWEDFFRTHNFDKEVVSALKAITKKKDEDYKDYIYRCMDDEYARVVKIYDLKHNLKLTRLIKSGIKDKQIIKYINALKMLEEDI